MSDTGSILMAWVLKIFKSVDAEAATDVFWDLWDFDADDIGRTV